MRTTPLLVGAVVLGAVCYGQVALLGTADAATTVKVVSVTFEPAQVGANGGTVTVTAKMRNASSCGVDLRSHPLFPVTWKAPAACKTTFTTYVKIGANPTGTKRAVALDMRASNGKAYATSQVFYVSIAPKVAPPVTTTTVPATTTTTTVPAPVIIPSGPAPVTTNTTLPPGTTTTTQPTTTTAPPPIVSETSSNWSGYELDGGPFTSVNGTFTVPYLSADAACGEVTSEWVGVDGDTANYPSDMNLLQAGVDEQETNQAGSCLTSDEFMVVPWWEELPNPQNDFSSFTVNPGDSLTVTISQSAGLWNVTVDDTTDGEQGAESFISYGGPGESAEWVTEAPTNASTGHVSVLAPYCTAPTDSTTCVTNTVNYSNLGVTGGSVTQVDAITMDQGNGPVSVPSSVPTLADLLADGFTTTYDG